MPVTLDYTNFFENLCKLKNMNILHHLCALFLSSLDINLGVDCLHVFVHHHHPAFYELCGIIAIILLSGQYLPQLDPRERGLFDVHEQRGKGSVSAACNFHLPCFGDCHLHIPQLTLEYCIWWTCRTRTCRCTGVPSVASTRPPRWTSHCGCCWAACS